MPLSQVVLDQAVALRQQWKMSLGDALVAGTALVHRLTLIIRNVEAHPFALLFDEQRDDAEFRLRESYFHGPEPLREEEQGSYAVPAAPVQSVSYVWLHRWVAMASY
ncbi:MAG TPA: hypothetical protein VLQ80_21725 [Candidatus Saccharimonadia bacterium]|nr:hypothetical protein [Candidatus Saccharimonadia bacterium]